MKFVTRSADETRALAAAFASQLAAGDVVLLAGDLGAGKTTFAQGVARGLGVTEPVTSPTFTIVQEYRGRVPVAHVDVYRLDRLQELHDLGIEEHYDDRVTLVEWGEAVARVLPAEHAVVRLEQGVGDDDRVVVIETRGARWQRRQGAIAEALASFTGAGSSEADG
jgi:tRNA threonylcarbamoyladenosine biosynthesis protein TsaE